MTCHREQATETSFDGREHCLTTGFDSPEYRSQIAAADVILASDPVQRTSTCLFGREMLEEIVRTGTSRDAVVVTANLDTASKELDTFESLVQEIKGLSSLRPSDLFPEFEIDIPSFRSHPDLLVPVKLALKEIRDHHRKLLPPVQLRFYYSIQSAGFTTANQELQEGAMLAGTPVAYITQW